MNLIQIGITGLIALNILTGRTHADEIHIAVASNFTSAMNGIVTEFGKISGHRVKVSFGSSGKFHAQIKNGAPFQIFFSADQHKPETLEKDGLTVPGARFTYAIGALALWSAKPGFVNGDAAQLQNGNFRKLALANPKLAPYGAAAVEVLEHLKLKNSTAAKWVQGENIAQTFQFVSTGNAELGFVALSQIMQKGSISGGSAWIIPDNMHKPIRQDVVLLIKGKDSRAAHALLDFVRSEQGRKIIEAYGYKTLSPSKSVTGKPE